MDSTHGREANLFYWTASDNDSGSAPYYNFGQNGQALHRQPQVDKQMAISVQCVKSNHRKLWPARSNSRGTRWAARSELLLLTLRWAALTASN
jgi:hypothetical protein